MIAACICSSTSHRPSSLELAIKQHRQHQQLLMQDEFSGIYRKTCPSNLNPENMKEFGGYRRNLSPTGERTLSLANDQHTSTDTCLYADVRLLTFKDMKSFIAWT